MDQSIWGIITYIGETSFKIILRTCWVLIVLAILDYCYQRWEYERGLKMSKQEIKEEHKQSEGDPMLKGKIKRMQRAMARKRMMSKVPKADVVVTNPDHIAVALKYDQREMAAPVVIAKGAALVAEKIKELARKNQVPIVENKPLGQAAVQNGRSGPCNPGEPLQGRCRGAGLRLRLEKLPQGGLTNHDRRFCKS